MARELAAMAGVPHFVLSTLQASVSPERKAPCGVAKIRGDLKEAKPTATSSETFKGLSSQSLSGAQK